MKDGSVQTVKMRITSDQGSDVVLIVEPWGMEFPMDKEESLEVVFSGPSGDCPEFRVATGRVELFGWTGSTVSVYRGGECIYTTE
ncbi:MAG: hypothetical protein O7H41_12090 [Planctomycetota bacterium]|nr:hypothetical protein [Planctomycetota bacterium]